MKCLIKEEDNMILERALEIQKELEVLAEERSKIIVKKNKLDDEMMAIGRVMFLIMNINILLHVRPLNQRVVF